MSIEAERLRNEIIWHLNQMEDQAHNDDPAGVGQHAEDVCTLVKQLAESYKAFIRSNG